MNKCIICLESKSLTEEHIVPEFVGGSLSVPNVCKECNSNMGGGFEGRLSNNFIYKSFRYTHKISGKSEVPFPFEGWHEDINTGTKIKINRDESLRSYPHCEIYENDEGIKIEIKVDSDEEENIVDIVATKLERYLKRNGKTIPRSKVDKVVSEIVAEQELQKEELSNPKINISGHINFSDIDLLHIKVAYELACFHFGEEYISDPVANELRLTLIGQTVRGGVEIQTPVFPDPFKDYINNESHWVIFWGPYCYVNICGFSSKLIFASGKSNLQLPNGIMYRFCYRSNAHCVQDFSDFVMGQLASTSGKVHCEPQ